MFCPIDNAMSSGPRNSNTILRMWKLNKTLRAQYKIIPQVSNTHKSCICLSRVKRQCLKTGTWVDVDGEFIT